MSPNFSLNVTKMTKWIKDGNFPEDKPSDRECQINLHCNTHVEWKKMQIVGNTPDKQNI